MPVSSTTSTTSTLSTSSSAQRPPRTVDTTSASNLIDSPSFMLPPFHLTRAAATLHSTSIAHSSQQRTPILLGSFSISSSLQVKPCLYCDTHPCLDTCRVNGVRSANRNNTSSSSSGGSGSGSRGHNHRTVGKSGSCATTAQSSNGGNLFNGSSIGKKSASAGKRKTCLLTSRRDDDQWVDISHKRLTFGSLGQLYSGSQFVGIQKGSASNYDVVVDIQYVDLNSFMIGGYLHISGLTRLHPEITTFFEGEIIGPKHSFLTRKWLADLSVDSKHWRRFPSFTPYLNDFNNDGFHYDPLEQDFVYMRWKEKFLVPNHRVNSIDGASYAGFYYICYQRSTNQITGFYYCRNNIEWYQELILNHVPQRQFGSFEFR